MWCLQRNAGRKQGVLLAQAILKVKTHYVSRNGLYFSSGYLAKT